MENRGQMQLSFGMIFSIILIVLFIAFAVYAIMKFLSIGETVEIAKFKDELQSDIDKMWKGSKGVNEESYFLPSKIKMVCFLDSETPGKGQNKEMYDELKWAHYETENLMFYPLDSVEGELRSMEIKHIDLAKTSEKENPLCFENNKGKLALTVSKNYGEVLVTITR